MKVELHGAFVRPRLGDFRGELQTEIEGGRHGECTPTQCPFERVRADFARERKAWRQRRTFRSPLIEDGEKAKRSPVDDLIVDKVHASALSLIGGRWQRAAM